MCNFAIKTQVEELTFKTLLMTGYEKNDLQLNKTFLSDSHALIPGKFLFMSITII